MRRNTGFTQLGMLAPHEPESPPARNGFDEHLARQNHHRCPSGKATLPRDGIMRKFDRKVGTRCKRRKRVLAPPTIPSQHEPRGIPSRELRNLPEDRRRHGRAGLGQATSCVPCGWRVLFSWTVPDVRDETSIQRTSTRHHRTIRGGEVGEVLVQPVRAKSLTHPSYGASIALVATGAGRLSGRVTTSLIVWTSAASFLPRVPESRYGATSLGAIRRTRCACRANIRAQWCAPVQASLPINTTAGWQPLARA